MNILYYGALDTAQKGGVGNVAYYLPRALKTQVSLTYFRGIKSAKNFPANYFNIFNQFVKKEFDIIHFGTIPAWDNGSSLLLRFANLRQTHTVLNIHGISQLERRANKTEPVSYIEWMTTLSYCNLADRIVVNSEYMRNNAVVLYRLNPVKVVVIPNGVDLNLFSDGSERMLLEGDPSILYVGHLSRLKGVDILIKAITQLKSELPNIKLHLVGGGSDRYFAALSKREGLEKYVVFHGLAEHSMLPKYYKSADICVFPSRHEGFGLVILEAMASGIPVVASDIPSFQEIISNGRDGRLFKAEDADDLSKEVIALYQNPRLRKELSRNASERAKMYSWENIANKYFHLYSSLCQ